MHRLAAYPCALMLLLSMCCLLPRQAMAAESDKSFSIAKRMLELRLDKQAEVELKKFITAYPDDPRVYEATHMLGQCYQQQLQFSTAQATYAKVINTAGGPAYRTLRAKAHFQLAECYMTQKPPNYEKAITYYANCRALSTDDPELAARAVYWLAECQYQLSRFADASKNYQQVAVIAPNHPLTPWAIYSIGMIAMRQQQYDPAIAALEQVTTRYADSEVCHEATLMLGYAYSGRAQHATATAATREQDYQQAIKLFNTVLENKTTRTERQHAALALGEVYFYLKNYTKAEDVYAKALETMVPNSEQAMDTLLRRAHTLYNSERYREAALAYAAVAKCRFPNLATQAQYWQGSSSYQVAGKEKDQKAYQDAITAFNAFLAKAGTTHPDAPRAALLIAYSLEDLTAAGDQGSAVKALTAFQDVIARWPNAREAMHAQDGIARMTATMPAEVLNKVAGTLPESASWSMQLSVARKEFHDGQYAAALTAVSKVLDGKPIGDVLVQANYIMGACQQQTGHPELAVKYYQQVINTTANGELAPFALRGLIQASMDLRQYKDARDAAQTLLKLKLDDNDRAQALMYLANALCANQQYGEALATYQQLARDVPNSPLVPNAYMGMAGVAEAKRDRTEAVARYREVIAKFPEHEVVPRAFFHIGVNLAEMQEYTAAIDAFRNVPDSHLLADQAGYAIAWAFNDQVKPEEANKQFEAVATQFPTSPLAADSLYRIGEYQLGQKRYADAAGFFGRALALKPSGSLAPSIAYKQGVSAFYAKSYDVAASAFDKGATEYANSPFAMESLFMKGQALDLQGGQALAVRDAYTQYLAKYPYQKYALDAAVGAGRAALAMKQYTTTRADLEKALALYDEFKQKKLIDTENKDPERIGSDRARSLAAEAQFYYAQSLFDEKNYTEAFKQYAAVPVDCEPWASRSLLQMGRCSLQASNYQDATDILQNLLRKYPDSDAAKSAPGLAAEYELQLKN